MRSLADGVLFEFGSSRQRDLSLRDQIRRWQPQLRTVFVTRIGLLKYRLRLPGFQLPAAVEAAQGEFDDRIAGMLNGMANRLEGEEPVAKNNQEDPFERLEQTVRSCCPVGPQGLLTPEVQAFLALSRNLASVTGVLDEEIGHG